MNFSVCHLSVKDQSFVRGGKGQKFWKENLIIKVSSQISIFPGEILDLFVNFSNSHKKEGVEIRLLLLSKSASMWIVGLCEKVTRLEIPWRKRCIWLGEQQWVTMCKGICSSNFSHNHKQKCLNLKNGEGSRF